MAGEASRFSCLLCFKPTLLTAIRIIRVTVTIIRDAIAIAVTTVPATTLKHPPIVTFDPAGL